MKLGSQIWPPKFWGPNLATQNWGARSGHPYFGWPDLAQTLGQILAGQTDRQTDRQTDTTENITFPHICGR